jgi:hypothetical protein
MAMAGGKAPLSRLPYHLTATYALAVHSPAAVFLRSQENDPLGAALI